MKFKLRPAKPEEADELSALVLRSKFRWQYAEKYRAGLADILSVSPDLIEQRSCWVAVTDEDVRAAVLMLNLAVEPAHLDLLFVDIPYVGKGAGKFLLENALSIARTNGNKVLSMDSDPNAAEFYLRHGGRITGEEESTVIPGQFLPIIAFDL